MVRLVHGHKPEVRVIDLSLLCRLKLGVQVRLRRHQLTRIRVDPQTVQPLFLRGRGLPAVIQPERQRERWTQPPDILEVEIG
jgi:hypothetical protein